MRTQPLLLRILAGVGIAVLLVPILAVLVGLFLITPPLVFFAALAAWVLLAVWLVLRRRGAPATPGNYSSLVGTHSAKAGLL